MYEARQFQIYDGILTFVLPNTHQGEYYHCVAIEHGGEMLFAETTPGDPIATQIIMFNVAATLAEKVVCVKVEQ
jgi:hypothetical protein